jgi:hypothetical protein
MSAYIRYPGVTGGGGGGGTPAGPANSIQFNNAGSFGGSSSFTFDPTTNHIKADAFEDLTGFVSVAVTNRYLASTAGTPLFDWSTNTFQVLAPMSFVNTYRITDLPTPLSASDAANKAYVDSSILALQPKAQVAVATTGPITLVGLQIIDTTYTTLAGDRVLVKNQANPIKNGIYIASTGSWARAADMPYGSDAQGAYMAVANGATNANKSFIQSLKPAIVDTDPLSFSIFNSNLYAASGQGIILTSGNVFALQIDGTTLTQSSSGVKVGDLAIADGQISNSAAIALSKLGLLVGYSSTTGTITTADSVTSAISKLNGNMTALVTGVSSVNTFTGAVSLTTTNIPEGTNLYFTNAAAIASTLTGYISGSGTITSADSILSAIQKLNGNIAALPTYTFSQSLVNTSGTVTLVNDALTPGNSYYYGTNASGAKGFFTIANPVTYSFSTGLTNTSSTITANLSTGVSGGQTAVGGTASGDSLTLSSTTNATKGKIILDSQLTFQSGLSAITEILGATDQALDVSANAPSASSSSQTGQSLNLSGANAVAGTSVSSAAKGGDVSITAGNAASFTTGYAYGGSITLTAGTTAGSSGTLSGTIGSAITLQAGNGAGTPGQGGAISVTSGNAGSAVAGAITITSGAGSTSVSGSSGNISISVGAPAVSSSNVPSAGTFILNAGAGKATTTAGGTSGAGGAFTINGGAGGAIANTTGTNTAGAGSTISILGAVGGSATGSGATQNIAGAGSNILLTAGAGGSASGATTNNAGVGGAVQLLAGAGGTGVGGTGGAVSITAGAGGSSNSSSGGAVTITSGANSNGTGSGGNITLQAGAANSNGTRGGNIILQGATPPASSGSGVYTGSAIQLIAGNGKNADGSSSTTGSAGGQVTVTSGTGGNITGTSGTFTAGAGASVAVTTGTGGNATGSGATSNTGGAGGNLTIALGTGGSASGATTNTVGASGQIQVTQTVSGADNTSMISLTPTWNTSSSVSCINISLTDTASGTGSKWANFTNGTSNTYFGKLSTTAGSTGEIVLFGTNGTNSVTLGIGAGGVTPAGTNYLRINSTTSLTFSSGQVAIPVGQLTLSATAGANYLVGSQSATVANTAVKIAPNTIAAGTMTMTSGTQVDVQIGGVSNYSFAPTSGTATYTQFQVTPSINQTGGASGITRSIYVNPTLTSAYDYRAFESTVGKVIMGGNLSAPAWTTNGVQLIINPATYTDTSSTVGYTTSVANSFGAPTFAASNAIGITNLVNLYLNAPVAGTNVTPTNRYALYSNGNNYFNGTGFFNSTGSSVLVVGAVVGNNPTMSISSTNGGVESLNISASNGLAGAGFYASSAVQGGIGYVNNASFGVLSTVTLRSTGSVPLVFMTNANERMRIDSTGNVLINQTTSNTNTKLTIKDGHIGSTQTTAPTIAVNANYGTGATAALSNATDTAGVMTLTEGTGAKSAGVIATVTFNKVYAVAPVVVYCPANNDGANDISSHNIYVTSTTTGFSINYGVAPNTSGRVVVFNYHAIETQ